jgi:hypothetical protein
MSAASARSGRWPEPKPQVRAEKGRNETLLGNTLLGGAAMIISGGHRSRVALSGKSYESLYR